jgi:hypothetical protein
MVDGLRKQSDGNIDNDVQHKPLEHGCVTRFWLCEVQNKSDEAEAVHWVWLIHLHHLTSDDEATTRDSAHIAGLSISSQASVRPTSWIRIPMAADTSSGSTVCVTSDVFRSSCQLPCLLLFPCSLFDLARKALWPLNAKSLASTTKPALPLW